ncbi:biotin/lipoyl-containing protein, partial [Streptomyces sp. NPDC017988]|uniref:biotin/lipoyl-containing protein n=1 Tax=Streptomyces sp. NPDC017988 TaxID=3365025 RepID=UPI0037AC994E
MAVSVSLPALGESVTEGTVTRWLKAEGERVEADEPLLEVSTDKVDTEIPAPASGILASIKVAEDETVEVGAELAVIDDGSGDAGGSAAPAQAEAPAAPAPAPAQEEAPAAPAQEEAPQQQAPAQSGGSAEGTEVTLPALGESVTEGTVTRWLKEVGEEVAADEPLLEVSTDKVDTEIPSPVSGVLLEIVVGEDETAEVGAKLAVVGAPGAAPAPAKEEAPAAPAQQEAPKQEAPKQEAPAPAQPAAPAAAPAAPAQPAAAAPAPAQPTAPAQAPAAPAQQSAPADDGAYVTPLVRKLASENGVNLSEVTGSGVGGRIRKQDVIAAAEAKKAAPAPAAAAPSAPKAPALEASPLRGQTVKMTRMRKVIGDNMMKALHSQA